MPGVASLDVYRLEMCVYLKFDVVCTCGLKCGNVVKERYSWDVGKLKHNWPVMEVKLKCV